MTAKAQHFTHRAPGPPVATGFVRHRQSRQAEGSAFWKGTCQPGLLTKAATQLQLKVLPSDNPKVAEIAARLPVGRVHATCRTFAPLICRDLYDKLATAAPNGNGHPTSPRTGPQVRGVQRLAARRPTCRKIGKPSASAIWLSQTRAVRTAGTRQSSSSRTATCSLRWRDYPRERRICASSTSAWIALSQIPTGRRDWESSNSCAPGKARQIGCSESRYQWTIAAQRFGTRSISIIWC